MDTSRRDLMALLAGGAVTLSGCSDESTDTEPQATGTPSETTTETVDAFPALPAAEMGTGTWGPVSGGNERPVASRSVGEGDPDGDGSHELLVRNVGPERSLDVTIVGAERGQVLEWGPTVPARRHVRVSLDRPDEYEAAIGSTDAPAHVLSVERYWFAAADFETSVAVHPDGTVEYSRSSFWSSPSVES